MENLSIPNNDFKRPLFLFKKEDFVKYKYILYFIFAFLIIFLFYFFYIIPPKNFPKDIIINISEGSSLRSVSKSFEENNLIKSRTIFETFVIIFGGEKTVISGDYYFKDKLSVVELSRRVSKGERHLAPIKVTIPEGFTVLQISEVFYGKLPNFNSENFLYLAKDYEGYLFPDTYFFLTTDGETEVIKAMQNNFNKKIESLQNDILNSGRSLENIIIMASLIEEESKGDQDREMISGILWKRLKIGMALQVDAEPSTYKERGLPKFPISNPGILSIKAAIFPKNSNYLYYLHDKNGVIHYGVNYNEHLRNIKLYLK